MMKTAKNRMSLLKKRLSLLLSLLLLLSCLPKATAESQPQKEEVVYVTLDAGGHASEAYVVNIFPAGVVMDYGSYSSVRMMNTEDPITYNNGLVSFISTESRVYYQGNMAHVELPWLFEVTWQLNGQPVTAAQMAGASGKAEMTLSIAKNPACSGDFFDTHSLQIAASLDSKKCANITAPGATQANVGDVRQLNWIVLPGTETDISFAADVKEFEMPALSVNSVRMQLDPGEEVVGQVQDLADGLEELRTHNDELTDGAKQLVDAAFQTANAQLEASASEFEMLGISLIPLTTDNYADEITRLQTELLENVDDYVLQQAEQQLRSQVYGAAAGMVRTEVEKAARAQVEQEVRKAAEQQVRDAVTAEVRRQVGEAMRNPTDENIETLVDAQMQSSQVQALIEANVAAQMASPTVQAKITREIEAVVRPQVEAAAEAEVRGEVEASTRQTVRQGIEKTMEAKIRAEVCRELGGIDLPFAGSEEPDIDPDIDITEETLPVIDPPIGDLLPEIGKEDGAGSSGKLPGLIPSILDKLPDLFPGKLGDIFSAAKTSSASQAAARTPVSSAKLSSDGKSTGAIKKLDANTKLHSLSDISVDEYCADPSLVQQIEAEVASRMASAEVQQQIDSLTDAAMESEATQALMDSQTALRMESPEVKAKIEAEVAVQVLKPESRAQAEERVRAEARQQAEDVAREQVRAAIRIKLGTMSDADIDAMVEEQMQSAEMQQLIDETVAQQMQSQEVQAMIDAETQNQMQSQEVRALMDQECAAQMQSAEVQGQINSQIASYRNSAAFLESVAEALEANGENGEAYQALVELRSTLDDVMRFYDGLVEYTDGVATAADGVGEARVGVATLLSDEESEDALEIYSFTDERNGAVKSVQFVMTVPSIEIPEETAEEAQETSDDGFLDKLITLFK